MDGHYSLPNKVCSPLEIENSVSSFDDGINRQQIEQLSQKNRLTQPSDPDEPR
jgi:hypothetical protein